MTPTDPLQVHLHDDGVAELVMCWPPVNAPPVAGWRRLAQVFTELSARSPAEVRVVLLRAEGRGFNAGVDIKELQRERDAGRGHEALVAANRACHAAFGAVYRCAVPVVAAVQGWCLGGGVGLVGNADVIVASDDATFGLPEVDRGALGAATHLARLVPPHKLRALVYGCGTVSAEQLHAWGSVERLAARGHLRDEALALCRTYAAKPPAVVRMAKESLNGIDPVDVDRSYRFEQGYTFELHILGEGDRARDAFVHGPGASARGNGPQQGGQGG